MEAADGNYGARLEYIRHMEALVGKIFELIQEADEIIRCDEALDQEYEERIKNGTEDDPEFLVRWTADDGTRIRSVTVFLDRTLENGCDPGNFQLALASSSEAAARSIARSAIFIRHSAHRFSSLYELRKCYAFHPRSDGFGCSVHLESSCGSQTFHPFYVAAKDPNLYL